MNYAANHELMNGDLMYGYDDEAMMMICASAYGILMTAEQAAEQIAFRNQSN